MAGCTWSRKVHKKTRFKNFPAKGGALICNLVAYVSPQSSSKRTEFGVMSLECPHRNDLHSCRISCCTSGCILVKARPNSRGRIQRTVAPSMMKGLPSASGKMQNSSSAPTEIATGLATRQPPGERSRSSPSPATIRLFDEKWLRNWTETRTC